MLTVKDNYIVDEKGNKIRLRGVNLGGWLMMEGYILYSPNIPEKVFKKSFRRRLGLVALSDFEKSFRDTFIQEADFKAIASWGFNCIRLPFNHRLIEPKSYHYSKQGLSYLVKAVRWAKKYNLRVILDLHAACGSQNMDWHSDSSGKAMLWKSKAYRNRTIALWRYLADIFKDTSAVVGYNLLNEPIVDSGILNKFYQELIREIRKVDKNHIIFLEPVNWAQDLKKLIKPEDGNVAFSIHFYQPLDFSFNLVPEIRYPFRGNKDYAQYIKEYLQRCFRISKSLKVPILVGEFGVNCRLNLCGEFDYLKYLLRLFKKFNFHWTYWTYKAVKNSVFPDGIYHYNQNPKWVNRQGPVCGWENYIRLWASYKNRIIHSWNTRCFQRDDRLLEILRKY